MQLQWLPRSRRRGPEERRQWSLRPKRKLKKPPLRTRSRPQSRRLSRRISPSTTHKESRIVIAIILDSPKIAKTIFSSVAPETKQTSGYRSSTRLDARGRILTLRIQAQDLVALRAASNSFLRFIAAGVGAIEVVAPFYRTRRVHRPSGA
ncbi:hypothetical protein E6H19_10355 [Candidatus Bathyarchaeota archaeon]|nr:MAG: hypothetical protein E6H19_10355 [Candidatus Bathyarchaeota archaeon]